MKTAFIAAKRRAGITRKLRLYAFRHAAITQMILNGDLKAASEIAGHRNIERTIRQYGHITSEVKKRTVEVSLKLIFEPAWGTVSGNNFTLGNKNVTQKIQKNL